MSDANRPVNDIAGEVYEIVIEDLAEPGGWLRSAFMAVAELASRGRSSTAGSMIVSVRERATGSEVFRHIEDGGDDEDHLYRGIQADLQQLTSAEFKARWVD